MDKRALYNLLRLNYQEDPTLTVESWQVQDYRNFSLEDLFSQLKEINIHLDKPSFEIYVENTEDPEDLTQLLSEDVEDIKTQDQVYLLVFELWRRLASQKPSISLFCDELDRKIEEYDRGNQQSYSIVDLLFSLQQLLDENEDKTIDPKILFLSVIERCANDVESFLYDFISDQLEQNQKAYARDLIEGFEKYMSDPKWFLLLKLRLSIQEELPHVEFLMQELVEYLNENDLEFCFEVLDFVLQTDQVEYFFPLMKRMFLLCEKEGDFQDVLIELYQFLIDYDFVKQAKKVQKLVEKRRRILPEERIEKDDPALKDVLELVSNIAF
ncbi:MAG: hypothetical protein K940chlam8_01053 [Chlamydiae bacterium]|nr:hypothetical protein [Chlamydiota bacterium]